MEQNKIVYIDANVFIYAVLDTGKTGTIARKLLHAIHQGKILGVTSAITYDELVLVVRKNSNHEQSVETGNAFLALNMEIIPVDSLILHDAQHLITHYKLCPKDAIHCSTMRSKKINTIISNDADFDNIKDIQRIRIEQTE